MNQSAAVYDVQLSLHAQPDGSLTVNATKLAGQRFPIVCLTARQQATPMDVTFDQAIERLEQLPRMFVELDGAFVWVSQHGDPPWQLDGCLYDRDGQIVYVDLVGSCPRQQFDGLLRAFGWPRSRLLFQLKRHGVYLEERHFRRYAALAG